MTKQEKQYIDNQARIAVKMLSFCGVTVFAASALIEELEKEGKFKQRTKQVTKNILDTSLKIYDACYFKVFGEQHKNSRHLQQGFSKRCQYLYNQYNSKVGSFGSRRQYQILVALSRHIEENNNNLASTYYFSPASQLYALKSKLKVLGYEEDNTSYKVIRNIDVDITLTD